MLFKQIVQSDLGCASYVIGAASGEALVVDPRWEIEPYVDIARHQNLRITRIVETHNHADHVSGHGRLAAATGAGILIHEAAGVEYEHQPLKDGEILDMGDVRVHVLHTPGHRPEHIALAVEDVSRGSDPWLVLTGDSLFVGDVARPDLAVDGQEGAKLLFESLHAKLLTLPEFVAVYPAHVAGSLCGRVNSQVFSTTLGYEKRHNQALEICGEAEFVRYMNENLPERPPNMERIVAQNRGPLVSEDAGLSRLEVEQAKKLMVDRGLVIDVRPSDLYLDGHVAGSLHVPICGSQFGTRAGFVLSPERPILIVAGGQAEARAAATALRVVAFDRVAGWFSFDEWRRAGGAVRSTGRIDVDEASRRAGDGGVLVDVRERNEWAGGTAPGALTIPFHQLQSEAGSLDRERPVALICDAGNRSAIGAGLLESMGFVDLINVTGGMSAWRQAGLPVEAGR